MNFVLFFYLMTMHVTHLLMLKTYLYNAAMDFILASKISKICTILNIMRKGAQEGCEITPRIKMVWTRPSQENS